LKYTRHIEISVERQEVAATRSIARGVLLHCLKCRAKAVMLPVEAAVALAGITPRTLYRWMEEEKVHFIESSDGTVLVCAQSFKTLT
jgi:hypothetical protein